MNALISSPACIHKETARVLQDTKGKERKHLLLLHWLFFVVVFVRAWASSPTASTGGETSSLLTLISVTTNQPTLPGASFWITSKKQTLKTQNTSAISKTGVINFLHRLRTPVHVLSGQSSVSANPIILIILFIFNSWYFIIFIFKGNLNPSRI